MKRPGTQAIVSIAAMLFLCLESVAQNPAPTPRPEEPTTGSINGKVISDNGQPLPGASVIVRSASSSLPMGRTTVTDSDGNFQLNNLDSALYLVYAYSPAYTSEQRDPDAQPVYYRIGDSVRVEMTRGGVITGTVTNNVGEPVVSVLVRAQMIRDAKGQRAPVTVFNANDRLTDDRGIYRIYGLMPGTYLVSAGGTSYQQFQRTPYDKDTPTYAPSSTRDNATEIAVRAGEDSTADIRYRGEPGHRVSGTIKNFSGQAATIFLSIAGTGLTPAYNTFMEDGSRGFAFFGVPDGEYDVMSQQLLQASPGVLGDITVSEPRRITVSGKDVSGIELTTLPMASIYGSVTLEPSKAPECQNKRRPTFAETVVGLVRNTKQEELSPFLRTYMSSNQPDKTGKFSIRNIRNGQYTLVPTFFARYWYVQSLSVSKAPVSKGGPVAPVKTDTTKTWLSLKSGDRINDFTIVLAEGAASIRGQVDLPEEAKPDENLKVFVVPAEREKADDVLRFAVAPVSADGKFALNNLAPGRYFVLAQLNLDPELSPEKIRLPNAAESRTKLRRTAEAAKVELELKPCQNLTEYKLNK